MRNYITIDSETRGKARAWLDVAKNRYATMERVCQSKEIAEAAQSLSDRTGSKQARAWSIIRLALENVGCLESVHCDGWESFGLWTIIKPRGPVLANIIDELIPEEEQGGITLNYLLIGQKADSMTMAEGLWTAEITIHALHSVLQHDVNANLDSVLYELQRSLLSASTGKLGSCVSEGMVVPAGNGAFLCCCIDRAVNACTGKLSVIIRAHSWIGQDKLREEQQQRAGWLAAAAGESALGTNWLLPDPLRSYSTKANEPVRICYLRC
jgi:hypothetical protein